MKKKAERGQILAIRLTPDKHQQFKMFAVRSGETMSAVAERLINQALKGQRR